jgi:hypothetical protein
MVEAKPNRDFHVIWLIRSVSGARIRIDRGFLSGKIMAKQENSIVISVDYTCYENRQSSCRLESISQPVK